MIAEGYTSVADLGGGIHYEVHLAHDHHRRTLVVVKALRPEVLEDQSALDGYARELEVLASIAHPSIVRLLSYDDEAEQPYMVLEHLDGPTLSSHIADNGPVQLHQWVSLAAEVTGAIAYLHDEGFVHLDIKPSNIIMGAPAKLIDMSLAVERDVAPELTHPLGTDEYMAPEQCRPGDLGVMGPASDVWGVGASLFRAAAGFRAWPQGGHPQLTDPPRALPDFVPTPVADLITAAMAFNAADRPTPDEMLDQLENIAAQLPKARLAGFKIKL